MSYRSGFLTGLAAGLILCAALAAAYWIFSTPRAAAAKSSSLQAPATTTKTLKEEEINLITLKPEAVERLALKTGVVSEQKVHRTRLYNGEITIPPGQAVIVSAPLSGIVTSLADKAPRAGQQVEAGQPIFKLMPLLTPEARANLTTSAVDASEQVKSAQTQVDATRIAFERAKRLFQNDAGSKRALDEAQAQNEIAQRALDAAKARDRQLKEVLGEMDDGAASPLVITAPETGLLRSISALPGQSVPMGAPLFEVANLGTLWVRVPVYVGDADQIDTESNASIESMSPKSDEKSVRVSPVPAPPTANAAVGTVDLYYSLDNPVPHRAPGQRVAVQVPLRSETTSLVAPWSAIVYDIHGGTWVYEQIGELAYVRRRVTLRYVTGNLAVLAAGPAPGTKVVEAGAAELFGTETGFTK